MDWKCKPWVSGVIRCVNGEIADRNSKCQLGCIATAYPLLIYFHQLYFVFMFLTNNTSFFRTLYRNWERKQDSFRKNDKHFVEIERYPFLSEFRRSSRWWRWLLSTSRTTFTIKYGVQWHDNHDSAASFRNSLAQELKSRSKEARTRENHKRESNDS